MTPLQRDWWKGSLPSWMGVALISVSMFAGRRLLDEHDRLILQVGILGNRVVSLESRLDRVAVIEARLEALQGAVHGPPKRL